MTMNDLVSFITTAKKWRVAFVFQLALHLLFSGLLATRGGHAAPTTSTTDRVAEHFAFVGLEQEASATATTWEALPPGPLIGFSAYQYNQPVIGGLLNHVGIFYMEDPTQYAPGNSGDFHDKYWTCADVGPHALQSAKDLSVAEFQGPTNVEINFGFGPTTGSDNWHYPAIHTNLVGRHPSEVYKTTPVYMGYARVPEGRITLASFLEAARIQGSAMLEMGGYDKYRGKDCQTFVTMMLMQLGLPGLADVATNTCNLKFGLPKRAKLEKTVPADVASAIRSAP